MNRVQKNVTLTEEQIKVVKENLNKGVKALSEMLSMSYCKVRINLILMGLIPPPKQQQPKKLQLSRHSYFNENNFFKYYNY